MAKKHQDREVLKEWVIKEAKTSEKLFTDVQRRCLVKEKMKSLMKEIKKLNRELDYTKGNIFESIEGIVHDSSDNYQESVSMDYDESKIKEGQIIVRILKEEDRPRIKAGLMRLEDLFGN